MDKVGSAFFFPVMKRLFIALFVIAGLSAVLGVSASAAGSITATLNEPLIDYAFVDDPDDPFESFSAYSSYAGRSEQFWTSEDPDLLMIPDIYLVSGMHFYIQGTTALGNSVRSNTVTYINSFSLPDVGFRMDGIYEVAEWDLVQLPSRVNGVFLCLYKVGSNNSLTLINSRCVYANSAWQEGRTEFSVLSFVVTGYGSLPVAGTDFMIRLEARDSYVSVSSGNLLAVGRNHNFDFYNPLDGLKLSVDGLTVSADFSDPTGKLVFLPDVGMRAEFIDDDTHAFSENILVRRTPFSWDTVWDQRDAGNLFNDDYNVPIIERSVRVRLIFYVLGMDDNHVCYSDWAILPGLDGLGDLPTVSDPVLIHPSDTEIAGAINLIYHGVKNTPVYKYVFSALVLCIPFMVGVFVINKVH